MIGVAAGSGGFRSSARHVVTIEQAQGALKPRQAGEALWRDADGVQKPAFQMTPRQARRGGERVHRHLSTPPADRIHGKSDSSIDARTVGRANQQGLHEHHRLIDIVEATHGVEFFGERHARIVERDGDACNFVLRRFEECSGAVRVKPDAQHCDVPAWAQQELLRQLAGKDECGLPFGPAVGCEFLEGLSEVDDQLRSAIGQYRVRIGVSRRVPLECPEAVDNVGQGGSRSELSISHERPRYTGCRICSRRGKPGPGRVTRMRAGTPRTFGMSLIALICVAPRADGQGLRDMSGTWAATKQAPATGKASPEPLLGQQIGLQQDGDKLTLVRWLRDTPIAVTYPLDGNEVRSRVPGGLCMGDAESVEAATREGNAITLTVVGRVPPGGGPMVKSSVKRTLRFDDPDTLVVEGTIRDEATKEPRAAATVYRRSSSTLPAVPPPTRANTAATISQLAWLSGVWIGSSGSDERWTTAAGGSMLAIGRTMRDGVMGEFEFLCIAERNGGLVYQAMPNGRSPATDFTLTRIDSRSATFENPAHDFPKAIRYTLKPDDTLEAVVSSGPNERGLTFTFKREKPY